MLNEKTQCKIMFKFIKQTFVTLLRFIRSLGRMLMSLAVESGNL